VHAAEFFLGSELGHTLIKGSDIDISDFNPLVVVNLELLVNDLWRSLDSQRFVGTFSRALVHDRRCKHKFVRRYLLF
jgi:hypothetical protein